MNISRLHRLKKQTILRMFLFLLVCFFSIYLLGCEAFVRKFTHKRKKDTVRQEPVLVPEEYSLSDISTEERYRQYFLFWQSWQEELITALGSSASQKKRKTCLEQAIGNLEEIRSLLFEEKRKELDVYLEKLRNLAKSISLDIYGNRAQTHKSKAESLKRIISRDFSYSKVKNHLR